MDAQKRIAIPVELGQSLLDYLSNRPWREVSNMIGEIQKCPILEVTMDTPAPPENNGVENQN